MVVHSGPASDAHCSSSSMVPNRLIKVWIGSSCPDLSGLVSLLTAALHLQPDSLTYWASHKLSPHCPQLRRCFDGLGVRWRLVNFTHGSPLERATRDFTVARPLHHFSLRGSSVADVVRQYMLNRHGGYFLDEDAFVTNGTRFHEHSMPAAA